MGSDVFTALYLPVLLAEQINLSELIINALTVLISAVSAISVVVISVQQSKWARQERQQNKKNTWYHSEVISEDKIKRHIDVEMREILEDETLSKAEICEKLNEAMLDFFYRTVNYTAFFDLKPYNELKQKMMEAVDNMMYSVLMEDTPLDPNKADKFLEIYRMKIIYLFYEYDLNILNIQ